MQTKGVPVVPTLHMSDSQFSSPLSTNPCTMNLVILLALKFECSIVDLSTADTSYINVDFKIIKLAYIRT